MGKWALVGLVAARAFMVAFVGVLGTIMVGTQSYHWPGGPQWFLAAAIGLAQALNALHALYIPAPPTATSVTPST